MEKYILAKPVKAEPITLAEVDEKCKDTLDKVKRFIGGYRLKYDDGTETWMLKDEFEKNFRPVLDKSENMGFGDAIEVLKQGGAIRRKGWNGKEMFVVKQVPAHIGADVLPKMQSLPKSAKDLILQGRGFINYTAQCLIYNEDTGRADSWVPSISDVFAEDWEIVTHTSVPCDHIPDEGKCCGSCCCGS